MRNLALFLGLLLSVLLPLASGCGTDGPKVSQPYGQVEQENAAESFHAYANRLFVDEAAQNSLLLHYLTVSPESFGIETATPSLGTFSQEGLITAHERENQLLSELSSIRRELLSGKDRQDYDVMAWHLSHQVDPAQYPYLEEPLGKTTGVQSQLPVLLAEYRFRDKEDVTEYLTLLDQLPAYLESIISYEREKSEQGLFMADFSAQRVISSIDSFLADREGHYLITTFEHRLSQLKDVKETERSTFQDQNRQILSERVFPAYENLKKALQELSKTGTNPGGLCNVPKGKEYYEKCLQRDLGTSKTAPELIQRVEKGLRQDLNDLGEILTSQSQPLEDLKKLSVPTMEPRDALEKLKQDMCDDFPALSDSEYEIKEVWKELQSTLSPAFYLTPPLDAREENTIYVNPAYNQDAITLFTTLAHEGFPGHMYQNLYAASCEVRPVRSLFSFPGYSEGYATYAEFQSYQYLDLEDNVARILQLTGRITLGLYARLDLAIHYEGWDYSKTHDYLVKYGITETSATTEIYRSIVEQPGSYLSYHGGCLEIMDLKEQAKKEWGRDFSPEAFHHYLLSFGEAPFDVLSAHLADSDCPRLPSEK